ncbi:hypothetical protein F0562_017294 [Nyssa sinensis]|uniref:DRBM domain-containing protein n=1 Tax=Nyssa sinensis TaxID=561372 RepID=A0A5J4ZH90_9ASTE|nr:hypothetical protein F0562_017294 [Nyssa sinensis]
MYKSKLQELCSQQAWRLPKYSTSKDGPDHNPRFKATVTVNGVAFETSDRCRSSKEAQNKAAQLAVDHFTTAPKPLQYLPNKPDALIPSSSGHSTPVTDFDPRVTRLSTGVTLQPIVEENIPIALVDETPLGVKDDSKSTGYSTSIVDFDSRLSTGVTLQPTIEEEIPITLVDETPLGVNEDRKSTGYSTSSINFDMKPSIGVTLQPTTQKTIKTPMDNRTPLEVKDDEKSTVVQHLYKNRLQIFAQKRNLALPVYSCERQGPPHASRFKSKVTIDGKTYESLEFFPTIKEAENAAAKVACDSLSLSEVQEDGYALYKSLLQELSRKKGFCLPKYNTAVSGPPHNPIFISTVEIGGQFFQGQEAKNKKQAEMNAAKVAYIGLQEVKELIPSCSASEVPSILYSDCRLREALKVTSSILQSIIKTGDSQQNVKPKAKLKIQVEQNEEDKGGNQEENSCKMTTVNADAGSHHPPVLPPGSRYQCKKTQMLIFI